MNVIKTILSIVIGLFITTSLIRADHPPTTSSECNVVEFYKTIKPNYGVKVLTPFGNVEQAELILTPTSLDVGSYKVNLTRKANNLYQLEGTQYAIETSLCLELAIYESAILKVSNNYGYTKGTVYFD